MTKMLKKGFLVLLSAMLVACGGSGSSSTAKKTAEPEKTVAAEKTAEPENTPETVAVEEDSNKELKQKLEDDYEIGEPSKFVRDKTDGKWRIAKVANTYDISDYAVDYANAYMKDGDIVYIVNFTLNTTTMLRRTLNILDVKTTEYVDKEEHDSSLIGMGTVYLEESYNLDTGEKYTTEADASAGTVSAEELVAKVKEVIDGQVGEGEVIQDVTFDGSNLTVFVDMSGADTKMFSARDISLSRISSITDEILDLDDSYTNTWETVTVDFGSVGKAVLDKTMIQNGGFGKYFDFTDDILK